MKNLSFFFIGVLFIVFLWYIIVSYCDIFMIGTSEKLSDSENYVINIENHPRINTSQNKMFFVETQNKVKHKLSGRQACSIESAAFMNPNSTIFVVFLTPGQHVEIIHSNLTKNLLHYKNIIFVYLNIKDFSKNTPLEQWIKTDKLMNSKYVVSHTSDVLRYLLLYKYSGLYLDMDVITTYPSSTINFTNFACYESSKWVNGAILKLTGSSGQKFAEELLHQVSRNFDGETWGKNGPELLTQTIKDHCNITKFYSTISCNNFTILQRSKCYAISWENWNVLFEPNQLDNVLKRTKNSYFVHLWNHFSGTRYLNKHKKTALNEIARKYCPKIYQLIDIYF